MNKLTNHERQILFEGLKAYNSGEKGYSIAEIDAELREIIRVANLKKGGMHAREVRRPNLVAS